MKLELWEDEKWLFRLLIEMVCVTENWNVVSEFIYISTVDETILGSFFAGNYH
jgi:hypothetical protein